MCIFAADIRKHRKRMKRILLLMAMAADLSLNAIAADDYAIRIHLGNTIHYALVTDIDSVYLDASHDTLRFMAKGAEHPVSLYRKDIGQISYLPASECPTKVKIAYDGEQVQIENPYFLQGVSFVTDGAYVTLTNDNTTSELTTVLSGYTADGGFTYVGQYKTTIELAGLELTSLRGAAIDIDCGKRIALEVKKETINTLTDAPNGTQKAALYCKGHLELDKAGTLNITGKAAHALAAKEYIKLKKSEGHLNILGAVKDGIHCKQYFVGNGFEVTIGGVGDDGLQTELDGQPNDAEIADGSILINDGNYLITNSTNGWKEGTETHTAKGINAAGNMELLGGNLNISTSGTGGKGIKVAGTYTQGTPEGDGPTLSITTTGSRYSTGGGGGGGWPGGPGGGPGGGSSGSSAKALKVQGALTIYGGNTLIQTSKDGAEGLESKTQVTIAGGTHYLKCYDDCISCSKIVEFTGGNTVCFSNGNDAVDSNYGKKGAIAIAGGNVFAYTTKGSPEEGLDCDNNSYITISGGIAVSAGGKQGGGGWGGSSNSVGSSTQGYYLGSSPSSYSSSYYYTLCNTQGEAICTYRFDNSVSNSLSLLTADNLGKGSITVKRGSAAPTESSAQVNNASGNAVFFIAPVVETDATVSTITAK